MAQPTLRLGRVHSGPELGFVRTVRRAIHRHPELGHHERRTAAYVERVLLRLGLQPFRPAPTSVAVVIGPDGSAPTIGFRADMDALPILEAVGNAYASRNPGVMHACGHDGHTAAVLTLARRLAMEPPDRAVLLVFQQAEESHPSGAPLVIAGLPDHLLPPEMFSFHIWPELPQGVVGVRSGTMMAAVAGLTFDVYGLAGRASGTAADSGGTDAVATAVKLYARLAPDTGRQLDDDTPTALSIGMVNGGEGPNRVAAHCRMEGTLRAVSWADQDLAVGAIKAVVSSISAETGARIDVTVSSGIRPPVRNAAASVKRVTDACDDLGVTCIDYPDRPLGVSEDFGWYLSKAQGAMFLLGCASSKAHADLHTPKFDLDEAVLLTAVDIFQALTTRND